MWLMLIILSYPYQGTVKQGLIWPVASRRVTSGFGPRRHPVTRKWSHHNGIDIGVPTGTSVRATASGTVTFAGWKSKGMGYAMVVDHGNGLTTTYGHLSRIKFKKGKKVERGQVVAYSGNSGSLTTGPHLYYEVRKNGKAQNPIRYLADEIQIASEKRPSRTFEEKKETAWKKFEGEISALEGWVTIVEVPKDNLIKLGAEKTVVKGRALYKRRPKREGEPENKNFVVIGV